MRILILGAGAVGGYFGGRLAEAGVDATFFVREPRARLLAEKGLRVESPAGDFAIQPRTISSPAALTPFDLVILTCKAYDLDEALASIRGALKPGTILLPLLNGVAHLQRIADAAPQAKVWGGVARITATLTPDGVIKHFDSFARLDFGALSGAEDAQADELAALFAKTSATAFHNRRIMCELWDKFVFLATLAGMNVLMRARICDIVATPSGERLIRQLLGECASIAKAEGYGFELEKVAQHGDSLTQRGSQMKASMLRDIEKGSRTEGEHILGDLFARATRRGLEAPLLDIALTHVRAYETARERGAL